MNCDFPVLGINLVFHVLSGVSIPGTPPEHESLPTTDHLARVGNGICVYHCAIEDPNLPLATMFRFRVVRGYISFSGFRFKEICGFKGAYVDSGLKSSELRGEAPINETRLEMAYLVHYFNERAQLATHWLHLPFIFRKLQRRIKYLNCTGNCLALYKSENKTLKDELGFTQQSWFSGLDKEEFDRTQKMLSGFEHAGDTWILLSRPGLFTIITGQPILLYALINRSSVCLVPFKDCLSCIMILGNAYSNFWNCATARFERLHPFSETIVSWKP